MTEQRTFTLLEAAEWFRYHPTAVVIRAAPLDEHRAVCTVCGTTAYTVADLRHADWCPHDAAVRAIEQSRKEQS